MPTKKLTDYFALPTLPASGGFQVKTTTPSTLIKPKVAPYVPAPAIDPNNNSLGNIADRMEIGPDGLPRTKMSAPAPAPVVRAPASTPGVGVPSGPLFGSTSAGPDRNPLPGGGATGAAPFDPKRQNADGSYKSAEQIAAEIGASLRGAHGTADIGTLAGEQFGPGPATTVQAEAEARRIGNTRNDIAVGETDPYNIASKSGIAYTPAELKAIENAYAGIYDPALDTALAKVGQKQKEDEMRLQAQLEKDKGYTLGKDEVRYENGVPVAVGLSDPTGVSVYVAGQDPTADAYVTGFNNGTYKATDIPEAYKGLVAQGIAQTKPKLSKSSLDAVSNIEALLNAGNLGNITGYSGLNPATFLPGENAPLINYSKQLKGLLSLENRNQLKGSGAISDFEFRVLGEAASALGIRDNGTTNLDEAAFKKELRKLNLKLQVGPTDLTDEQLLYLQNGDKEKGIEPMTPDEIREYSQYQSFSSVGNTTASTVALGTGNRPQRNNNPGNIKSGGLADSLAVGKDDQGHLIFPDAETGLKALTLDLTAKVNGQSQHLPANPTIAELGKVYAEDPNWPKAVAAMLGVTTSTPTKSVSLQRLAQAIATQEGFYA